jgi:hypothetical protein
MKVYQPTFVYISICRFPSERQLEEEQKIYIYMYIHRNPRIRLGMGVFFSPKNLSLFLLKFIKKPEFDNRKHECDVGGGGDDNKIEENLLSNH